MSVLQLQTELKNPAIVIAIKIASQFKKKKREKTFFLGSTRAKIQPVKFRLLEVSPFVEKNILVGI